MEGPSGSLDQDLGNRVVDRVALGRNQAISALGDIELIAELGIILHKRWVQVQAGVLQPELRAVRTVAILDAITQ